MWNPGQEILQGRETQLLSMPYQQSTSTIQRQWTHQLPILILIPVNFEDVHGYTVNAVPAKCDAVRARNPGQVIL